MTSYPPPTGGYPGSPYPTPGYPGGYGTYAPPPKKPTDVFGRRIGAYAIDMAIAFVIWIVMFLAVATTQSFGSADAAKRSCDAINNGSSNQICVAADTETYTIDLTQLTTMGGVVLGYLVVNHVLLTGLTGFSFGKLIVGIRVVNKKGSRCGVPRAALRTLLFLFPDHICGVPIVGIIVGAVSDGHRRVGDWAAGTAVVHKDRVGQDPFALPGPVVAQYYGPSAFPGPSPAAGGGYVTPGHSLPPTPPAHPTGTGYSSGVPYPGFTGADPTLTDDLSWPTGGSVPPPTAPFPAPPSPAPLPEPVPEPTLEPRPAPVPVEPAPAPAPTEPVAPEPATDEPAPDTPGVGSPHWDESRNTYIQWDPVLRQWMCWRADRAHWEPLER